MKTVRSPTELQEDKRENRIPGPAKQASKWPCREWQVDLQQLWSKPWEQHEEASRDVSIRNALFPCSAKLTKDSGCTNQIPQDSCPYLKESPQSDFYPCSSRSITNSVLFLHPPLNSGTQPSLRCNCVGGCLPISMCLEICQTHTYNNNNNNKNLPRHLSSIFSPFPYLQVPIVHLAPSHPHYHQSQSEGA